MRRIFVAVALSTALLATQLNGAAAQDASEQTALSPHFSITWAKDASDPDAPDLTDGDSDGIPDGVEGMLAGFETARAFLVETLGYQPPPESHPYPLYVAVGDGRGYTRAAPGGAGRSRPSYILIPPGELGPDIGDDEMVRFAAHEFHHAIQIGYDADEPHWIGEATSSWVEDVLLDERDPNHHLLRNFVPFPRLSLATSNGAFEYGAFLFLQFLQERYGDNDPAIVRELWAEMAVPEAIPGAPDSDVIGALETVLARRGATPAGAWGEFLLWRWDLGRFQEGAAYQAVVDDLGWPLATRTSRVGSESCRLTSDLLPGSGLPALSGDYVELRPGKRAPATAAAVLTVAGPPGATGFALLKRRGVPEDHVPLAFDAEGTARIDLAFGRTTARRVLVGLGNGSPTLNDATLAYSLRIIGRDRTTIGGPFGGDRTVSGVATTMSGSVTCKGRPEGAAIVWITESETVSGRTRTFEVETDASGAWFLLVTPEANARYSVELADPLLSPADSLRQLVVAVEIAVTIETPATPVAPGTSFVVSGATFPAHAGAEMIVEFRRPERLWRLGTLTETTEDGRYAADLVLPHPGIWEVRARMTNTGDTDHEPGISGVRLVRATG